MLNKNSITNQANIKKHINKIILNRKISPTEKKLYKT